MDPGPARPKDNTPKEKKPMETDFYERLVHRKKQEREMKDLLRDIAIYLCYVIIIFIISYGNRDPNAFLQRQALKTAVVHGGLNCGIGPEDDPQYKDCEDGEDQELDLMHVTTVNQWYKWLKETVKPNVRVQYWYNGKPPYGLRGYLDDKANRIIGYAIIRQVRQGYGYCRYCH